MLDLDHSQTRLAAVTEGIARHALRYRLADLPASSVTVARQCLLDWFGVTLAGAEEPAAGIVRSLLAEDGSGSCTIIGSRSRHSSEHAALANGIASHALDYDDVHTKVGHASVPVLPAVLAVAESVHASAEDALVAYIAGYEACTIIGALTKPSHYARGFHSTGTLGSIGAAVAAGLLMKLDQTSLQIAISLAATQSSGLKGMFGTMAKPLHAGKAAANGIFAARLAERGFDAPLDGLERAQGFIYTLSNETVPMEEVSWLPSPGSEIAQTLFKYHAACYLTHSSIDAITELRDANGFEADDVAAIRLHVPPGHLAACNIFSPMTGLESKFSLRHVAALVLRRYNTASIDIYTDENATRDDLCVYRDLVTVIGDLAPGTAASAIVRLKSGQTLSHTVDTGIVCSDLERQGERLSAKFHALVDGRIGSTAASRIERIVQGFGGEGTVAELMTAANEVCAA